MLLVPLCAELPLFWAPHSNSQACLSCMNGETLRLGACRWIFYLCSPLSPGYSAQRPSGAPHCPEGRVQISWPSIKAIDILALADFSKSLFCFSSVWIICLTRLDYVVSSVFGRPPTSFLPWRWYFWSLWKLQGMAKPEGLISSSQGSGPYSL